MDTASLEIASVESNGRILSGVGVSEESLTETMQAREKPAPTETAAPAAETPKPEEPRAEEATGAQETAPARADNGQFAKQPRGAKRFDQLTKERATAEQERDAERARAQALEARLEALERQRQAPAPQERPAPAPQPQQPAPAEPDFEKDYETQVGVKYATYGAAVQAFNRDYFAFQQRNFDAQIRSRIEADRASRDFRSHVSTVFDQGRASYPDFDAVVARSQVQFPDPIRFRIAQAPNAAALLYALCQDDQTAQRIASLTDPIQIGWELAQVVPPSPVASPASTAPVVSTAPAPYQPVGSGSKTTQPSLDEIAQTASDYDTSGYRERRRQERLAGRR